MRRPRRRPDWGPAASVGFMRKTSSHEVTRLLLLWSDGDAAARDELVHVVQPELHRLARRHMVRERPDHTLQATALINEVYLRLIDWRSVGWQDRAHFFAVAAWLMRRTLVDHARRHNCRKRGAGAIEVSLDEAGCATLVGPAEEICCGEIVAEWLAATAEVEVV